MALTNWFHENYSCINFPWVFKWIFVPVVILNFIYLTILYRTSYRSLKGSLLISVDHGVQPWHCWHVGQVMALLWVVLLCIVGCSAPSLTKSTGCQWHRQSSSHLPTISLPLYQLKMSPYFVRRWEPLL